MKTTTTLALLGCIAIGAGGSWLLRPAQAPDARPQPVSGGSRNTKIPRDNAADQERNRVAKRWLDRMEGEAFEKTVGEIPAGDLEAVIEKMMSSMWGGMSDEQAIQLSKLISAWAEKDPEEALAWARGLDSPQQREIALVSVAGTVGKKDPMAGFEIYAEVGKVTRWANGDDLDEMMGEVYKVSLGKGIDAFVDIVRRTPENESRSSIRSHVEYPENFDFATLIEKLAPLGNPNAYDQPMKPMIPTDPLATWASRDPDAAFDFVVRRIGDGRSVNMSDFIREMNKRSGALETEIWVAGKLAALGPSDAARVLDRSGMLHDPGSLRRYIAGLPEEQIPEFRYQMINASPFSTLEILQDVPVEERVSTIERLRDVKHPEQIRFYLTQWKVPKDRVDEIMRTVVSPGG